MTTTNFSAGTVVASDWLNDVDDAVYNKLHNYVNVKSFGAVCDGATDDWAAIQAAQEYLKTVGGGTLFFPGFSKINQTFYFYGSISGGWSQLYPEPNEKKITWASNGNGGIISSITSGDVLRLSKDASNTLSYKVGFKDFVINCSVNNVVAINGTSQTGLYGDNHYLDIDTLLIHGIEGVDAIGIDFGTVTDSIINSLSVQGWGTGPYAGVRINKADVQLVNCSFVYCRNSVVIGELTEACVQALGCKFLNPKSYHIFWEYVSPDTKTSASILTGCFVGETTASGSAILGAAAPSTLDVGSLTFEGCVFDNYRSGQDLMTITWGGRFTFIGNAFYDAGAGGLATVDFGIYSDVMWLNNTGGLAIKSGCGAITSGKVNKFTKQLSCDAGIGVGGAIPTTTGVAFPATAVSSSNVNVLDDYEEGTFAPTLVGTGNTFNYETNGQVGFYTKIGNLVHVLVRIQLATTGNTLAANAITVGNLPYAAGSGTFNNSNTEAQWANTTTSLIRLPVQLTGGGTSASLFKVTAGTTSTFTALVGTDLHATNGTVLTFNLSYFAAT